MVLLAIALILSLCLPAVAQDKETESWRWFGHDFVFCFLTDDGNSPNLAWAETAREMGFRYTIAVNVKTSSSDHPFYLTLQQIHDLAEDGFEIANHSYSHANDCLPETCPYPPKGSLMGYFLCEELDPVDAMAGLHAEIERDSVSVLCDLDVETIKTLAYPRHLHGKALIDSLIAEGYIGARTGGWTSTNLYSYGEFPEYAHNSWEGGISLFRVPTRTSDTGLFGDHSAVPPVHFTYEQFYAAAQPRIEDIRNKGGMFVIYTHHLGNDDDSYGDINHFSGGITQEELAWLVDLVRDNGGIVMPFGEAVEYYRARTQMVNLDGDYVWMPPSTDVGDLPDNGLTLLTASPNPFNPRTIFEAALAVAGRVSLDVYDAQGAHVRTLVREYHDIGRHQWNWDGRDDAGALLGAGVYMARLETLQGSSSKKVMLLK